MFCNRGLTHQSIDLFSDGEDLFLRRGQAEWTAWQAAVGDTAQDPHDHPARAHHDCDGSADHRTRGKVSQIFPSLSWSCACFPTKGFGEHQVVWSVALGAWMWFSVSSSLPDRLMGALDAAIQWEKEMHWCMYHVTCFRTDAVLLKRYDQTGFWPPGRPKRWKSKALNVLEEAVRARWNNFWLHC